MKKTLRILTKEDARALFEGETIDEFVRELTDRTPLVGGAYAIPRDSGAKTQLAKLFAYLLFSKSDICIYITVWNVFTDHIDLFYGYRLSVGETRLLIDAPVHLFERTGEIEFQPQDSGEPFEKTDEDALISVMCMVLYFFWDAWIFDLDGKSLLKLCHDEWLEVRTGDEELAKEVAAEFEQYHLRLLHSKLAPKNQGT